VIAITAKLPGQFQRDPNKPGQFGIASNVAAALDLVRQIPAAGSQMLPG